MEKTIIPLNKVSEAFKIFSDSLIPFINMEERKQIEVTYDRSKDILYIQFLPPRPARMGGFEFDFYIRYDWDEPSKIVGFEWLDFSKGYQGIDHIDEIISVDTKFDIKNTRLKNLSLRDVFDWAYKTFVQEMVVLDEFLIAR